MWHSVFYCIGCEREALLEEGAMCESCGVKTCIDHKDLIDTTHFRPKYWKCKSCLDFEKSEGR